MIANEPVKRNAAGKFFGGVAARRMGMRVFAECKKRHAGACLENMWHVSPPTCYFLLNRMENLRRRGIIIFALEFFYKFGHGNNFVDAGNIFAAKHKSALQVAASGIH